MFNLLFWSLWSNNYISTYHTKTSITDPLLSSCITLHRVTYQRTVKVHKFHINEISGFSLKHTKFRKIELVEWDIRTHIVNSFLVLNSFTDYISRGQLEIDVAAPSTETKETDDNLYENKSYFNQMISNTSWMISAVIPRHIILWSTDL